MPATSRLTQQIKAQAHQLGFDLVGIAPAVAPVEGVSHLERWLQRGFAGEMAYMQRHAAARQHPEHVLDGVRSVIMAAMNYNTSPAAEQAGTAQGRISRYAWGQDYHEVLRTGLKRLVSFIRDQAPDCRGRVVVDTAPLLERDFARLAGIGWIGKNTMLIHKRQGSWLFLGAVLLDIELEYDQPHQTEHCGTCTRCLDACPTDAFAGPYQLDSRRCISYLTIELRQGIPEPMRPEIGNWLFGCDICQEVCPWNRKAPVSEQQCFRPRAGTGVVDPEWLLGASDQELRDWMRGSALSRAGIRGLRRNAATVLGNAGHAETVPALVHALANPDPVVSDAAAWALGRISSTDKATNTTSPARKNIP